MDIYIYISMKAEAFRAGTTLSFSKTDVSDRFDTHTHSRDREERLDSYCRRDYDRYDSYRYIHLCLYINMFIYKCLCICLNR